MQAPLVEQVEDKGLEQQGHSKILLFTRRSKEAFMNEPQGTINIKKPVAFLQNEALETRIAVYKKINLFQRFMMRICFGLKYMKA